MRGFWPDCCSLLAQTINYLFSLHPETMFLDVILRSPANSGTTKNLEILRGVYLELVERLRMTKRLFFAELVLSEAKGSE